jgi:hypothetical protein
MNETNPVAAAFGQESRKRLAACLKKIKHCLAQLSDDEVWWRPREAQNSIANLILHLGGNVRQWIVAGVGGAADVRDRPQEFAARERISRAELLRRLEGVVAEADAALAGVAAEKLLAPRQIQGFAATGLSAIYDSVAHFQGHTQEIVFLTRLQRGAAYQFEWQPSTPEQGACAGQPEKTG